MPKELIILLGNLLLGMILSAVIVRIGLMKRIKHPNDLLNAHIVVLRKSGIRKMGVMNVDGVTRR